MALRAGRVGVHPSQVDPNGKVKAGLSPEQQAKLDRALLTPISAPVETEIVGISTGREQLNIGIGEGLKLVTGKIGIEFSSSDAGKILKVKDSGDGIEWSDPPSGGATVIDAMNDPTVYKITDAYLSSGVVTAESGSTVYLIDIHSASQFAVLVTKSGSGTANVGVALSDDPEPVIGDTLTELNSTVAASNYGGSFYTDTSGKRYVAVSNRSSLATVRIIY